MYKIKQKHTKHSTVYTMIRKWKRKNMEDQAINLAFDIRKVPGSNRGGDMD